MKKIIETSFKRIETKYIVAKDDVKDLIKDLKEYVVEDCLLYTSPSPRDCS